MATLARYRSLEAPLGRLRRRRCASFARGPRSPRSLSLAAAAPLQRRLAAPCLGLGPRLPVRLPPKVGGCRRRSLPFGRSLSGVGGRRHGIKSASLRGPCPAVGRRALGRWALERPRALRRMGFAAASGAPRMGGAPWRRPRAESLFLSRAIVSHRARAARVGAPRLRLSPPPRPPRAPLMPFASAALGPRG